MGDSPASPEGVNSFGFACVVGKADAEGIEHADFDAHEQGGVLPVVGITPALAKGTIGVEPADETEKAVAAKPEALVPWAQDKAGHEVKTPRRDGEELDALPLQGEHLVKAMPPQGTATKTRAWMQHDTARQPDRGRMRGSAQGAATGQAQT